MNEDLSSFGEHFIVGLSGPALLEKERALLAALRPAGIILFRKNIDTRAEDGWLKELRTLVNEARECSRRDAFFVSIDHEGGKVHRFLPPVTQFPAARYWKGESESVGRAMGSELRALGFNLDFAPVLDIHSEPRNTVIGMRAFGTAPEQIVPPALAFVRGLEQEGVMACAKHFPGHGATLADSHQELPVLLSNRDTIERRELIPFGAAIAAGIALIMTAHVRYPSLDPDAPATLSPVILKELLRRKLDFRGAIISDDLEMAALSYLKPAEKAINSLIAGVDILLEANPKTRCALEIAVEMAEGLRVALENGTIKRKTFEQSKSRLAALHKSFIRIETSAPEADSSVLGSEQHAKLCATLMART